MPKRNKIRREKKKRCVFNENNLSEEKNLVYTSAYSKDRQFSQINKNIFYVVRKIPMPYGREKEKYSEMEKKVSEIRIFSSDFVLATVVFSLGLVMLSFRWKKFQLKKTNSIENFNMNIFHRYSIYFHAYMIRPIFRQRENVCDKGKKSETKQEERTTITNKIFYYGNIPIVDMYLPNK